MKYTKENIAEGIKAKINSLQVDEGTKRGLLWCIPQYPKEIEQNILEWINNEPLTDVDCHGESIVRTMAMWNFTKDDIPQLICGFVAFKEGNFRISNHIWQAVTGEQCVYDGKIN